MSVPIVPIVMTMATAYSGLMAVKSFFEEDYTAALAYGVGAVAGFTGLGGFDGISSAIGGTAAPAAGASSAALGTVPQMSVAPAVGDVATLANMGSPLGNFQALQSVAPKVGMAASPLSMMGEVAKPVLGAAAELPKQASVFDKFTSNIKEAVGKLTDIGGGIVQDSGGNLFDKITGQSLGQSGSSLMDLATSFGKPLLSAHLQDKSLEKRLDEMDKRTAEQELKDRQRQLKTYSRAAIGPLDRSSPATSYNPTGA